MESFSQEDLSNQIGDMYRNLYDVVYLRTHPITRLLVQEEMPSGNRGWQVHHLLLDLIQELDPGSDAPVLSREWRRHQLLVLRFVDGLEPQAVADELSISRRQFFREQKGALDAIAEILWQRHRAAPPVPEQTEPLQDTTSVERMELLRLEAARIRQADRHTRIPVLIDGMLPLLDDMLAERRLVIQSRIPQTLPAVTTDPGLLRQMLLAMLGYLSDVVQETALCLAARVVGQTMHVTVTVDSASWLSPDSASRGAECVVALGEMAEMGGARITTLGPKTRITGFELQLPISERTVLVIDDNQDVLALFTRYLHASGYDVATAQTAQEALALAHQIQPYAITLDLMMPDQDGWDLLQTLLHQPDIQHIPVIITTVLKQKALALSLGATAFLEKPVSGQALISTLQSLDET